MKHRLLSAAAIGGLGLCVIALIGIARSGGTGPDPRPPVAGAPSDLPAGMDRGEYLARAADCVACHTAADGKPYAGGRPFTLPFGTLYATNITPDRETGIGAWTDEAFVRAVRAGVGSHGHLYPAMPYTSYARMSREDVLAIKAYLSTLPPVRQATPANHLSFPFDQRWGMAVWNAAFFTPGPFMPEPHKDAAWNRGAYLAGALGHCGECHTPRNIGFAMKSRDYLAGTLIQGWKAYNTTGDQAYGIGAWSDGQVAGYLSRGHAPGRGSAAGPMAEVVENSLQYLTPGDIDALVLYLRGVAPVAGGDAAAAAVNMAPPAALASGPLLPGREVNNPRGKALFAGDCASCHQWNGEGRQTGYAALVGSRAVNDPSGTALVQVLLHGSRLRVGERVQMMPAFGDAYSNSDIAALANYVLVHFGSKPGAVTAGQVEEQRRQR